MRMEPALPVRLGLAFLLIALPAAARAQVVFGDVVAEDDGTPVRGADLALVADGGAAAATATSDSAGAFSLEAPGPGWYRVVVERVGYRRFVSSPLELAPDRRRHVRVELTVAPIPLPGVVAETEANHAIRRYLVGYGVRLDDLGRRFISPEDIERHPAVKDFLSLVQWQGIPGVQVGRHDSSRSSPCVMVRRGTPCALIVVNGAVVSLIDVSDVAPETIESMVVLRPSEATLEFGTAGGGGALLIFTKGYLH